MSGFLIEESSNPVDVRRKIAAKWQRPVDRRKLLA
jgi:hypothetical protein